MRKDSNLRTYGRHKNRVIVADVWLSDEDRKQHVFSTSSDKSNSLFHTSSSDVFSESLNSTGHSTSFVAEKKNQKRNYRKTNPAPGKENKPTADKSKRGEAVKAAKNLKKSVFSISTSSDSSAVSSDKAVRTRALRDRNNKVHYNDSAEFRKQMKGISSKRKRPVRTCTASKPRETSVNFSDFDNYSLVISDSPVVSSKPSNELDMIETSTPVAKRTRCKTSPLQPMSVTSLAHIEDMPSPVSETMETPESVHSCSIFNTPSLLSSLSSKDDSNFLEDRSSLTNKSGDPILQLQRLTDSLIVNVLSGNTANQPRNNINNYSASLFSTPEMPRNKLSFLTGNLVQKRNQHQQKLPSPVDQDSEHVSDHSYNETTHDEDDDENDTEEEEDYDSNKNESDTDLSAINEDEEDCSESEDGSESDGESDESDDSVYEESESVCEESLESDCKMTRNTAKHVKKSPVKNLERLSESLLMNHVIDRRKKCRKTGQRTVTAEDNDDEADMSDIVDRLEMSHLDSRDSDSNCTLYMINEDYVSRSSKGSECARSSIDDIEEEAESEEELSDTGCKSLQSEQSTQDTTDVDDGESGEESPYLNTPPKSRYSLRNKHLKELQNSFTEMLTPVRRKSSLVPLSAQARVLLLCDQTEPIGFKTALPGRMLSQCKKIGEGVYGEVFRSRATSKESVAIKVIPIEGDFEVNDEPQKKFSEIIPEVVIAKELSNLRNTKTCMTSGFCQVNSVSCVQGKYPPELLKQWDVYHSAKGSENDRPDMFPATQLYIVFEFADCGTDLESYMFDSISQGKSVLTQVAFALAAAEESLQFEHRDLHWGNVLVRPTDKADIKYRVLGKTMNVPSLGVEASVIDFTLSRLTKDGCTVYTNLAEDKTLFEGKGDYQFDIYRGMKESNQNNWETFTPHSNVLWLHYLADKLVYSTKYASQSSRQDRDILRQFRQFMSQMLQYSSSLEMVMDAAFLNS